MFDLPHRPAHGRDDFLVTDANAAAVAAIERWPQWRNPAMIIIGPAGSGKTHLAAVWQALSGANEVDASQLSEAGVPELLSTGALLIEGAPSPDLDERALFHAINLAREHTGTILITTRRFPAQWPVTLPDLVSRLKAAEVAELQPPDDALLRGVLGKQFADRQIAVDEAVIAYMLTRMERSFDALRRLVDEIDRRALAARADVTRPFVARVMADLTDHAVKEDD
ncbi:MAG: HdaA/DnaA family protein [Aestuariivirgaceae bacterium]